MPQFWKICAAIIVSALCYCTAVSAQTLKKLRPLRIALPSPTIAAAHFYVGRSLGVFESHGFDPQILVLEPRAALAALMTGDLDFYTATGTSTRAALRGVPVRVAMVGLNRPDHVLVASREITTIEQLRGKSYRRLHRQCDGEYCPHGTAPAKRPQAR